MGLLGGDSNSKQKSTQSSTGSQTQAGPSTATSLNNNKLKNSTVTVTVNETDHGAIREGFSLASQALATNSKAVGQTLYSNQKALESAFDFGGDSLDFAEQSQAQAYKVFNSALGSIQQSSSNAIQEIAGFAEQSATNPDGKLEKVTLMGFALAVLVVLGPSLIERIN